MAAYACPRSSSRLTEEGRGRSREEGRADPSLADARGWLDRGGPRGAGRPWSELIIRLDDP